MIPVRALLSLQLKICPCGFFGRNVVAQRRVASPHSTLVRFTSPACETVASEDTRASISAGKVLEMERAFSQKDVADFVRLTGDSNPIHTSEDAARRANFGNCVVNGMLAASLFPAIIGSSYVSSHTTFLCPA
jgi:hypothetical protein